MLQSLETVEPAIANSATEALSMPTDLIFSNRLQVQVLLQVFSQSTLLSCSQSTYSMCRVLKPYAHTPLMKIWRLCLLFFVHVNGFLSDQNTNCGQG